MAWLAREDHDHMVERQDPLPARTTVQAGLNAVDIEIDTIIGLSREDARS